jgi:chemotaxis protein methyltransferase CheR
VSLPDDLTRSANRLIQSRTGLVIPKLYQERVEAGLRRAQAALGAPSMAATLAVMEGLPCDSPAWQAAIATTTVGETNFLRHREWFAEIESTVLAPLIEARGRLGPRRIALWSAGCSTGEEAYSLAMIVDRLLRDRSGWAVRIIGTDINAAALARAREGIYHAWAVREVDAPTLARSFVEIERGRYRLSPPLQQMVEFRTLNLCDGSFPDAASGIAGFDLIICRNVLIYFSEAHQSATAGRLVRSLAPGGWLAVAPAEASAEWYRPLTVVNRPGAILFRNAPDASADSERARRAPMARRSAPRKSAASGRRPVPPDAATVTPVAAAASIGEAPNGDTLSRARALADRGEHAQARLGCEQAIAANALDLEAHLLLAMICLEAGDVQAALEGARCAAYLDPDSPAAHYTLGTVLHRLGEHDAARRKMATVLRLLQMQPVDGKTGRHFDATAAMLREGALGYLAGSDVAVAETAP